MDLLKALSMPFQLGSLLFVATTSMLLALILSVGGIAVMLGIPAMGLMAIWLTQYTFKLIDDTTNGVREAAAADAEMLSPWGDARCWVHPLLTVVIATGLVAQPQIPRWPVIACCALLFPASLGAIALSGRALDAINPFALVKMMQGLAHYYLLAVLWVVLCVAAGALLVNSGMWMVLKIAAVQLLLLLACSFIGGVVFLRRVELGFEPRVSPERVAERVAQDLTAQRQHMIDTLFTEVRSRQHAAALKRVREWLNQTAPHQVAGDVKAILEAGAKWSEPRGLLALLRDLVPLLLSMRQPALALAAVEAALVASTTFAPADEGDAVAVIRHALQTGRRRLAATLLGNFMNNTAAQHAPGPELLALKNALVSESK
jgi:hypothetical protein